MDKELEEKVTPVNPSSRDKTIGTVEEFIDHDAEKKIIRKIDLNLITLFGCLYLMSFLG